MSIKVISRKAYILTLLALLVLTLISYGLAHVQMGAWEMLAALSIAAVKCMLVLLFFMNLLHERLGSHITIITGVSFVAILLSLIAVDLATRPDPGPRQYFQDTAAP